MFSEIDSDMSKQLFQRNITLVSFCLFEEDDKVVRISEKLHVYGLKPPLKMMLQI